MARFGRTYVKLGLVRPVAITNSTFNESPTDAENLTDSLLTTETFNIALVDSEGLADSLLVTQTDVQVQTDLLGLSDSLLVGQSSPVIFTDNEGLIDSVSILNVISPATPVDLLGSQDVLSTAQNLVLTLLDSPGLSDVMTIVNPNEIDYIDALTASDNVLTALSTATTISDTEGTTDLISITLGYWEGAHVPHSSSGFGEIYIDRCFLVEKEKATESNDGKLSIAGQESSPPTTVALVTFLHGQVVGLQEGKLVPVIFRDKSERNAYYTIGSSSSDLTDYQSGVYGNDTVATADWTIELTRAGSDSEVDLQSRLTGAVRLNDFSLTGQKWHAPAVGHYAYYTGTTNPTTVSRTTSDGVITVYLGIPDDTSPKWGCTVSDYHKARVRIFDTREVSIENEIEGLNRNISATGWSMFNGLVNVTPTASAGIINVAYYDGSSYIDNYWALQRGFVNLTQWDAATIIRNDFEQCILRLTCKAASGAGRTTVDLNLRRGSRFIEGYIQNSSSTSLKVMPVATTASSSGSGYQIATTGTNRVACGSAKTFSVDNTNGGIFKTSVTVFDFWIGPVINAASPATGDAVTDLRNQYIGSMPEIVYAVRR